MTFIIDNSLTFPFSLSHFLQVVISVLLDLLEVIWQGKGKRRRKTGASLVVQWLRIRLPMQGTQVQALAREDPTYHGATNPLSHNY